MRGGRVGGGVSVCLFVSVCQKVIQPRVENGWGGVQTFHLFGQLGFASNRGEVPIIGELIKDRFWGLNGVGF